MIATLKAESVSVGYDNKLVISGVDIMALKGQMICLLGPNGSGKSTLLHTLSGHLAPLGGTVYIAQKPLESMSWNEKAKHLSVVLTERPALYMTTVRDIVSAGRTPYTGLWGKLSQVDERKVCEAMEIVGLTALAERNFMGLSDGEKQKTLIARALAQEPELIILDEPTNHLDINSKIEIIDILSCLAHQRGVTIIMSLHDIDLALKACQNVILVKDGHLLYNITSEESINNRTVESLFGITKASFDTLLESVEIHNSAAPLIFIAAGAGSGIPFYRALTRNHIGFATGVLHEGDIDCRIAQDMSVEVIKERPFSHISDKILETAKTRITKFRFATDTAFPVGEQNIANIKLLHHFLDGGGTLFSMRSQDENMRFYQDRGRVIRVSSVAEIIKHIRSMGVK